MTHSDSDSPCEVFLRKVKYVSIPDAIHAGLEALVQALDAEQGSICLIVHDVIKVVYRYERGSRSTEIDAVTLSAQNAMQLIFRVMGAGNDLPISFDNSDSAKLHWAPFFELCGADYRSNLIAHLGFGGAFLGILTAQSNRGDSFSSDQLRQFMMMANAVSLAIHHERLVEQLQGEIAFYETAHPNSSRADQTWEGWVAESKSIDANSDSESCPECAQQRRKLMNLLDASKKDDEV
ncbi:GAF domain-containing protein [Candidatus Obscuribacterales bacterium]|nr:GAF domain-containing protein [Candidatus Obscuribacterales bacterium]